MVGRCEREVGSASVLSRLHIEHEPDCSLLFNEYKNNAIPTGQWVIFIRKAKYDSKRATAALTITASGLQLQPCVVFKGECSQTCWFIRGKYLLSWTYIIECRAATCTSCYHRQLHL